MSFNPTLYYEQNLISKKIAEGKTLRQIRLETESM